MAIGLNGALVSELFLIIATFLIIFIIFALGKVLLGLLANIILGFIAIFIINAVFGIGIPFNLIVIIITAILGLPGVAIVVILKLLGIAV